MGVFQCPSPGREHKERCTIMADNGMHVPHEKHQTCGTCRHPAMSKTRAHVRDNPLPAQKNAATNEG